MSAGVSAGTAFDWALATLAVGAMGYAIQRGGTCTVAAVDEVLGQRRVRRLAAMLEASLWVAGGLAVAGLLHLMGSMPGGYAVDRWTVAGGALLGLGAWVNRACVFGAIARFGSGEWAYAMTPLGFFAGCLSVATLFPRQEAPMSTGSAPLLDAAMVFGPLFLIFAAASTLPALLRAAADPERSTASLLAEQVWTPRAATIVIGVTFVVTLLAVGTWAYTDVLAALARGMGDALAGPLWLFGALLAGASLGGWTAGRFKAAPVPPREALRCFAGGALMGWGSLLIPGSNDGLILIGIPLLRPYAWVAFGSMCLTIAAALLLHKAWKGRDAAAAHAMH